MKINDHTTYFKKLQFEAFSSVNYLKKYFRLNNFRKFTFESFSNFKTVFSLKFIEYKNV